MRRILELYVEYIISAVILAMGLTFLFCLLRNAEESRYQLNDNVTTKINVTENGSGYEGEAFRDTRTMSEVLYEIKDTDMGVQIYIANEEITTEMRKKFRIYNDSSDIRSYMDAGYNYSKEYMIDTEGKVVKIIYRPAF